MSDIYSPDSSTADVPSDDISKQLAREDPLYSGDALEFFAQVRAETERNGVAVKWAALNKATHRVLDHALSDSVVVVSCIEILNDELRKNVGRPSELRKHANTIPPEVIFYLIVRTLLSLLGDNDGRVKIHKAALAVGVALEQEIALQRLHNDRYPELEEIHLAQQLRRSADSPEERAHFRARYWSLLRSATEVAPMDHEVRMNLGFKLVGLLCADRSFFAIETVRGKITTNYVISTPALKKSLRSETSLLRGIAQVNLPLICSPLPWKSCFGGGYYTARPPACLVKKKRYNSFTRDYEDLLKRIDLSEVLSAVNVLQSTPWTLDRRMVAVIQRMYLSHNESDVGGERFSESHLLLIDKLCRDEKLYYSYQLDYRGRAYANGPWLRPNHSGDVAKALLRFHERKPLGEEGARRMAIHGSHFVPAEKILERRHVTLEERYQWVRANEHHIKRSAEEPFEYLWWQETSKSKSRFQFLAFCMEWVEYLQHGAGYASGLPVAMDGTCNGLQHFSALLRDENIARRTNVAGNRTPADIYDDIAHMLRESMCGSSEGDRHVLWSVLINRKLTKPIVMNTPYGMGVGMMREKVRAHMQDPEIVAALDARGVSLSDKETSEVVDEICARLDELVKSSIPAARDLTTWLKKGARRLAALNVPVVWVSPIGLPVMQPHFQEERKQGRSQTQGKFRARKYTLVLAKEMVNVEGQVRGIAPNFVHSLDASHMMKTVNGAVLRGFKDLRMNHDSFATHAADAETLAEVLRAEFHRMYEEKDWLGEMTFWLNWPWHFREREHLGETQKEVAQLMKRWAEKQTGGDSFGNKRLLEAPAKGDFNLEEVCGSLYFFA